MTTASTKTTGLIKIATRGSALALIQANEIKQGLLNLHPNLTIDLVIIKTRGDRFLSAPLAEIGGKGLFVKEIEDALLDHRADLAVHSMKDMPTEQPDGLTVAAVAERANPFDALVAREAGGLDSLPVGGVVGTSSLRRQSQLLNRRPDLRVVPLRGNVDTRLKKLTEEGLDAVVLAAAGLERMNLSDRITEVFDPDVMLPAIGQGALGIQIRTDDRDLSNAVAGLNHAVSFRCVTAERAFLNRLSGDCHVPVAAFARGDEQRILLTGLVADPDGRRVFRQEAEGPADEPETLGAELAEALLLQGADAVLADIQIHD